MTTMQIRRSNLPSLTVKLNPTTTPDLQEAPKSASPMKKANSARFYFKSSTTLIPNTKSSSSRIVFTKEDKIPTEPSYSFLPKLTQYQVSRSARWDILGEDITKPDLTEENRDRNPRIKALLKEFLKLKNEMVMMPDREKNEHTETIFAIAESILTLYKISISTITVAQMDSIMELGPLKSKAELLRGFLVIIPEICRFPYSFYTKIDLISFSFGGSLNIIKRTDRPMLEKKLFNGVFPLGVLVTDEQIVTHFYKTVAFHLKTTMPDFETRLTIKTRPSKSISLLMNTLNFAPPYESPKKKNDLNTLEEYGKLLKKLILQPIAMIKTESETVYQRVRLLKVILEEIDMDGIDDNFWRSLDSYSKDYTNGFLTQNKWPKRVL